MNTFSIQFVAYMCS